MSLGALSSQYYEEDEEEEGFDSTFGADRLNEIKEELKPKEDPIAEETAVTEPLLNNENIVFTADSSETIDNNAETNSQSIKPEINAAPEVQDPTTDAPAGGTPVAVAVDPVPVADDPVALPEPISALNPNELLDPISQPSSVEGAASGSGSEHKRPKGLVSYDDDEGSSDEESLSDMDLDTDDMPLSKEQAVNLNLYDVSTEQLPSPAKNSPNAALDTATTTQVSSRASEAARMLDIQLPPEPDGRCSKALQEKIARMIEKQRSGRWNVNEHVQQKKEFRNPSIYEKLISYIGIEEHGTNYPKHLYDPSIWGEEDYYEALARKQKEYHDKKEKEKQKRAHVDFISGTKKVAVTTAASSAATAPSAPALTSQAAIDNKRSKWDIGPIAGGK